MCNGITKSLFNEIDELIPHIDGNNILASIVYQQFGKLQTDNNLDYSMQKNMFLENLVSHTDKSEIIYYVIAVEEDTLYAEQLIDLFKRGKFMSIPIITRKPDVSYGHNIEALRTIIARYSFTTLGYLEMVNEYYRKLTINSNTCKYFIMPDNKDLDVLRAISDAGLQTNIVRVNAFKRVAKRSINAAKNTLRRDKDMVVKDVVSNRKLTRVMQKSIESYGHTEKQWYETFDQITSGTSCNVSFSFKTNSDRVLDMIVKAFGKGHALPTRFWWSKDNETIIGAIVLCDMEEKDKFVNRLKLLNANNINIGISIDSLISVYP